MNPVLGALLTLLIPTLVFLHLYVAPFTKVEESFNIQATRDILVNGLPLQDVASTIAAQYDHVEFPGAVPRTFVGAAVLAGLTKPWAGWVSDGLDLQLVARGILGIFNSYALVTYRGAVSAAYGKGAGVWFLLLQASQFHVIYYASRTLPNMLAFGLVTLALKHYTLSLLPLNPSRYFRSSFFLLTFSAVIFRGELLLLLYTTAATRILTTLPSSGSNRSFVSHLVILARIMAPPILTSFVISLLLTLALDTLMWPPHRPSPWPLWPEAYGFYFNAVGGQSSDWGTSPWHFYLTSSLPRLLLNPLGPLLVLYPLTFSLPIPLGAPNAAPSTKPTTAAILLPPLAFVALYSLLPHKEWRFVIYAVPPLTAAAAAGANALWTLPTNPTVRRIARFTLTSSVLFSFSLAFVGLAVSSLNYPGGTALTRLRGYIDSGAAIGAHGGPRTWTVYADNLACQTGVTRFLTDDFPNRHSLRIVKSDNPERWTPDVWAGFDFALVEHPERTIGSWEVLDVVWAFAGAEVVRPLVPQLPAGESDEEEAGWAKVEGIDPVDVEAARRERANAERARERVGLHEIPQRGVDRMLDVLSNGLAAAWNHAEGLLKEKLLRGWWIKGRMEPKVWILRREGLVK